VYICFWASAKSPKSLTSLTTSRKIIPGFSVARGMAHTTIIEL
jgi:hypothetical protein